MEVCSRQRPPVTRHNSKPEMRAAHMAQGQRGHSAGGAGTVDIRGFKTWPSTHTGRRHRQWFLCANGTKKHMAGPQNKDKMPGSQWSRDTVMFTAKTSPYKADWNRRAGMKVQHQPCEP